MNTLKAKRDEKIAIVYCDYIDPLFLRVDVCHLFAHYVGIGSG